MEGSYEEFKLHIEKLTTINLDYYKEKQMKRRINTLIERYGIDNYDDYLFLLRSQPEKLEYFLNYITINVTEFFRTTNHWSFVEEQIIPDLINSFGTPLKIWSAGCSSGEEPFSLAMSLSKYLPLEEISILATDIDKQALENASRALYSEEAMESVSDEYRERFFDRLDNGYSIKQDIKECVNFERLDLFNDEYPKGCHLIVCRNVLIYFTDEGKEHVFNGFIDNLVSGGCLFLGNAEQIIHFKDMGLKKNLSCIYTKL